MNRIYILLFLSFYSFSSLNAQFGYRYLYKEQSSESFAPLKYQTLTDSIGTGYGFPNPTANNSIVFTKEKPTTDKTKDWKVIKVKYVEIYSEGLLNKLQKILNKTNMNDSLKSRNYLGKKLPLIDTLKIYYLRNMKGNVAKGINSLIYENSQSRLFGSIVWENYYVPHKLVFFQTKELSAYDSDTYFFNYNSHKAFKRSAKRIFKKCPEILERTNSGKYFPRNKANLKRLADDYESLCSEK